MVYCALCKQSKETSHNWYIQDRGATSTVSKLKICDDCAALLLKGMTKQVMGIRDGQPLPNPLVLSKLGVIDEIVLNSANSLDITIAIDVSKARRWVEKEMEAI